MRRSATRSCRSGTTPGGRCRGPPFLLRRVSATTHRPAPPEHRVSTPSAIRSDNRSSTGGFTCPARGTASLPDHKLQVTHPQASGIEARCVVLSLECLVQRGVEVRDCHGSVVTARRRELLAVHLEGGCAGHPALVELDRHLHRPCVVGAVLHSLLEGRVVLECGDGLGDLDEVRVILELVGGLVRVPLARSTARSCTR